MTQKQALEILKSGAHVFLTGPPGSGKTYLLNQFVRYLRHKRKRAGITASTGIAATHINGISIHSWSGLGVKQKLAQKDIDSMLKMRRLRQRFKQSHVLVIDEISMLHAWQLDLVNQIAQAFRQDLTPFGGLQVVMCGDLFQLPPVVRDSVPKFVTESDIWPQMDLQVCYLTEQFRHQDDGLLNILNEIRSNKVGKHSRELLGSRLYQKLRSLKKPIKLHTLNIDVDRLNQAELFQIRKPAKRYVMKSRGHKALVGVLQSGCLAPAELLLKAGAQVMFVKNNFEESVVNGTLGIVVDFDDNSFPVVKTLSGRKITAEPASWIVEENDKVQAEIKQVPLRLAWAITVHKSQGMSLDAAEINLAKSFVPGMGYVALSRIRSLEGMTLQGINELALQVDPRVLEIDRVLQELSCKTLEQLTNGQLRQVKRSASHSLPSYGRGRKFSSPTSKKNFNKEKTKNMIVEKLSIQEIASKQGFTQGTIIKHIEKLVNSGEQLDIEYLLPAKPDLDKITKAFGKCGIEYLNPVYEYLQEYYDYDQLRLVRAWQILRGKDRKKKRNNKLNFISSNC